MFAVVALAELPDKSLIATLWLATRYRALFVFLGAAAALLVHVVIAVAAGRLLALLPHRLLAGLVALLFAVGGALLLWHREDPTGEEARASELAGAHPSALRVAAICFAVVFAGEWGDATQIAVADYAARYRAPIAVGLGALAAFWLLTALAVTAGRRLLAHVRPDLVRRLAGLVLLGFAAVSAAQALS